MIEVHGLRVAKMNMAGASESQTILVEDGPGFVRLSLGSSSYPGGLSPTEARELAKQLLASARRVATQTIERDVST